MLWFDCKPVSLIKMEREGVSNALREAISSQ